MINSPVTHAPMTSALFFKTSVWVLLSLFFMLGCASSQRVEEVSEQAPPPTEGAGQETAETPKLPADGSVAVREIEVVQAELSAVKYLVDSAQQALAQNQLEKAEAVANRALKIDRRAARAYLVKAEAQYALENYQQSLATAEQGMIYAPPESDIGVGLRLLIENSISAISRLF